MAENRARSLFGDEALEQGALRLCRAGGRDRDSEGAERSLPGLLVVGADEILLSYLLRHASVRLPAALSHDRRERAARLPPALIIRPLLPFALQAVRPP